MIENETKNAFLFCYVMSLF